MIVNIITSKGSTFSRLSMNAIEKAIESGQWKKVQTTSSNDGDQIIILQKVEV
jgi:hypothetical protein